MTRSNAFDDPAYAATVNAHRESGKFGVLPNTEPETGVTAAAAGLHSEVATLLRDRRARLLTEADRVLSLQRDEAIRDIVRILPANAATVVFAVTNEDGDVVETYDGEHELYFSHVQDEDGEEVELAADVRDHLTYEVHDLFGTGSTFAPEPHFEKDTHGLYILRVDEDAATAGLDDAAAAAAESLRDYGILDQDEEDELRAWGTRLATVLTAKAGATAADITVEGGKAQVTALIYGNERVPFDSSNPEHNAIQDAVSQIPTSALEVDS